MKLDTKNAVDFIIGATDFEQFLYNGLWKLGIVLAVYLA